MYVSDICCITAEEAAAATGCMDPYDAAKHIMLHSFTAMESGARKSDLDTSRSTRVELEEYERQLQQLRNRKVANTGLSDNGNLNSNQLDKWVFVKLGAEGCLALSSKDVTFHSDGVHVSPLLHQKCKASFTVLK